VTLLDDSIVRDKLVIKMYSKFMNASLIFDNLNHRPTDAELHCPGNNENVGLPRPGQRSASFSSVERDCSRQQTLEEATE